MQHILHEQSCNHFQWFPHTPVPPRPLKRLQNEDLLLGIFPNKMLICFESPLGYRSLVPPWGHNFEYWEKRCSYGQPRRSVRVGGDPPRKKRTDKPTGKQKDRQSFPAEPSFSIIRSGIRNRNTPLGNTRSGVCVCFGLCM